MKNSKNSVQLTGRAGSDPVITNFDESNKKLARVSIAISEYYKNADKQVVEQTNWFNLIFWNKNAEQAENLIKKGTNFSIEGKLISQSYMDKQDQKRYSTEIVVDKIIIE